MSTYTRRQALPLSPLPADWLPAGPVAYLDIETTGLSPAQAQVTLVGLVAGAGAGRGLQQHFVDDPDHEAEVLRGVARELRSFAGLITYNGQTFDLPFLRSRAAALGVRWPRLPHFDLLAVAREWRRTYGILSDCRLQTVMAHFQLGRTDSSSGYEMVLAYRRWLRTGDPAERDLILEHNAQDLLLLPDLAPLLTAPPDRRRAAVPG